MKLGSQSAPTGCWRLKIVAQNVIGVVDYRYETFLLCSFDRCVNVLGIVSSKSEFLGLVHDPT